MIIIEHERNEKRTSHQEENEDGDRVSFKGCFQMRRKGKKLGKTNKINNIFSTKIVAFILLV